MAQAVPIEINHVKSEGMIRITWNDGHVGEYPKAHLRGYCPCALCQGHGPSDEKKFIDAPDVELAGIEPVGNYAVSFVWADGHRTGIYTYEYLRGLCPCPECEARKSSA